MNVKLTVLCDNSVKTFSSLIGEHGFACFIETDNNKFLFDTGQGLGIIHNAFSLNIDIKEADGIILSHGHWDHTGGLESVLKLTGRKKIYAHPDVFAKKYGDKQNRIYYSGISCLKEHLELLGGDFVFNKAFSEIVPGVYLTGEVPRVNDFEINPASQFVYNSSGERIPDPLKDDNSVVIDSPKGLIVVLGCAHAGVVNILDYVYKKLNKNIFAVIGGTHLKVAGNERFRKTVGAFKKYDIKHIGVSHCTGPEKSAALYNEFKDRFFFADTGIEFSV
ncbi:MAG: MBL fold metallo-hydrolase [Victivallales bacterium]|nr:MBL fold metallo-hydrolase [Victivallales bacterium]MCF7889411.1 MBL fold metallo-hydrolase [Victivallales bacterium]